MSKHHYAVIGGGFVGGGFWLLSQYIGSGIGITEIPSSYLLYAFVGGIIAAGIGIYIPENIDLAKTDKILFTAILGGLSFPAALNSVSNGNLLVELKHKTEVAKSGASEIIRDSLDAKSNPSELANKVVELNQAVGSGNVSAAGAEKVKAATLQVIENLANSAEVEAKSEKAPKERVDAIKYIGDFNPELRPVTQDRLADLAKSENQIVRAAAKEALRSSVADSLSADVQQVLTEQTNGQSPQ